MFLSRRSLQSVLNIVRLGRLSYEEGLQQQAKYVDLVKAGKADSVSNNYLLLLEHFPVYTVGIRSQLYSSEEEARLKALGAHFHRTSRGGLITFHGPGQLVAYLICDVRRVAAKPLGVRLFVDALEQAVIDTATKMGVRDVGRSTHNTGVWVGANHKLAALGIAVQHGVSYHGLALNCNTDLSWFEQVVGCGIEGAFATSLSQQLVRDVSVEETMPVLADAFGKLFDCRLVEYEREHREEDVVM